MGPRRTRVGLRRIDAAYDALSPMGFSNDVVRKTIRSLLKAYGGDEGWRFIEDGSYQLVIDTILAEQANNTEQENLEANCSQENDNVENEPDDVEDEPITQPHSPRIPSAPVYSPLATSPLPAAHCTPGFSNNVEDEPMTQPCPSPVHSPQIPSAPVYSPLATSPQPEVHSTSGLSNVETSQCMGGITSGLSNGETSHNMGGITSGFSNGETSQAMGGRQSPSRQSSSPVPLLIQLPSPANSQPVRRLKPCYGWISSDDEEQELVYLAPSHHRHR